MLKNKKRIYDILQLENTEDIQSLFFDIFIIFTIIINLFVTLFSTFDESIPYTNILEVIEFITIIIFL